MNTDICKFCNEEITDDKVVCDRCKAPYHRDCWIKNRRCVMCDCRTCREVYSLNKKSDIYDKPYIIAEPVTPKIEPEPSPEPQPVP